MLMLNRNNHGSKVSVGVAVAVLAAAHVAAGVILCKGFCHPSGRGLPRLVKRAGRTVKTFVREIL